MVTIPQATSPFQFSEPIVNEQGLPTDYFLRKWQELLEINAANDETITALNAILAVAFTASQGLEGGGTLEEPEIDYALGDTAVTPGNYISPNLTIDQQGRITSATSAGFAPTISSYFDGAPAGTDVLARYVATRAITLPEDFVASQGFLETAATAQTDFDITKNGSSIGTMRFAASGTVATFISAAAVDVAFAAGDRVAVIAPGTPDATAAGISFSLQTT